MLKKPFIRSKSKAATVFNWEQATAASKHKIVTAPSLHECIPVYQLHRSIDRFIAEIHDLFTHHLILFVVLRNLHSDLILIRYFTTKMLLASLFALWFARRRLLFIVQNNMQLAHVGTRERWYFRLLCRLGFQFAFLEAADGLTELGVKLCQSQFVTVPMPIYPKLPRQPQKGRVGLPAIGVIGRELPEKNTDKLLRLLVDWRTCGELAADIVFGSDDHEMLQAWARKGLTTVYTTDYLDYLRAVADVDVLLIHYDSSHYFYRSSGVIHKAAWVGTAVVCPDFPVFRYQVTQPVRVGALFQSVEGILPAIQSALEITRSEPENFAAWAKARSPEEFSRRIDRFIERRW